MAPPSERRLATVLFLDIVGSTRIASDIGDHRWQELLGQFRRLVRLDLKKHGGREINTQGDSFLATFQEPVRAIRSAFAIAGAVQQLGIEVRLGVHTGGIEWLDGGNVAGLAVHIGAPRLRRLPSGSRPLSRRRSWSGGASASWWVRGWVWR
jgi:class 3 adenylate cyclase